MRAQLEQAGLGHALQNVLAECARVRAELGWPVMVTPFSQLVGTQAVLNVVQGERYRTVPDEVKKYALGYYGKLLAPVDPDVLDRIVANGSPTIALTPAPPEPGVPSLRQRHPAMSDDERLLRYMYAGTQVDDMLAAGPTRTDYPFEPPVVRLLRDLVQQRKCRHVYIEREGLRLELTRAASGGEEPEKQRGI
jgi:oxaloacetate decarboxylase alpha subunit